MMRIDRNNPGDLLKYLRAKRVELDAMSANLDMPIPLSIDDVIWLLEKLQAEFIKP